HHDGAGLGIDPLPQTGSITGQGEGSSWPWLHDPSPVDELAARRPPKPPSSDRPPLDELAAAEPDEGERGTHDDDRERDDDRANVEAEHQARGGDTGHRKLESGEPEQDAAP